MNSNFTLLESIKESNKFAVCHYYGIIIPTSLLLEKVFKGQDSVNVNIYVANDKSGFAIKQEENGSIKIMKKLPYIRIYRKRLNDRICDDLGIDKNSKYKFRLSCEYIEDGDYMYFKYLKEK